MSGKTGGQAAFETYVEIVTGIPGNWELEEPEDREAWEAAAAAGAASAHERTAELVHEVNELREIVGEMYEHIASGDPCADTMAEWLKRAGLAGEPADAIPDGDR